MSGFTYIIEETSKVVAQEQLRVAFNEGQCPREAYECLKALIEALPNPWVSLHWVGDDFVSGSLSVSYFSTKDHRDEPTEYERVLTEEEKGLPKEQKDMLVKSRLQFKV